MHIHVHRHFSVTLSPVRELLFYQFTCNSQCEQLYVNSWKKVSYDPIRCSSLSDLVISEVLVLWYQVN